MNLSQVDALTDLIIGLGPLYSVNVTVLADECIVTFVEMSGDVVVNRIDNFGIVDKFA